MPLPTSYQNALPAIQAAAGAGSDRKTLVCMFLHGGNDAHNTVPPRGANHANYLTARGSLALSLASILPLDGISTIGLHPNLAGLQSIWNSGKMAILANVGNLSKPITKAEWNAKSQQVPAQLFSHSDQTSQAQSLLPNAPQMTGWIGRMTDLMEAAFNKSGGTPATVPMNQSIAGVQVAMLGNEAPQYQLTTSGAITHNSNFTDGQPASILSTLDTVAATGAASSNKLRQTYAATHAFARQNSSALNTAISPSHTWTNVFPTGSLGQQLRMAARLIKARAALNQRRQVIFVSIGGFDQHAALLTDHGANMTTVNAAVKAFWDAMLQLDTDIGGGVAGSISNTVTLTSWSEFGRTLIPNQGGADHGWGGHHFIIGGAVNGGAATAGSAAHLYGTYPDLSPGFSQDAGRGALIPTTSFHQYAATLAKWFGIPDALSNGVNPMDLVVPSLSQFTTRDLGFMG